MMSATIQYIQGKQFPFVLHLYSLYMAIGGVEFVFYETN